MADLLDAVPDSVFICTKAWGESKAIRSVYANFKMNNFFGRDVIHTSKNRPKKSGMKQAKVDKYTLPAPAIENDPLRKRIFAQQDIV